MRCCVSLSMFLDAYQQSLFYWKWLSIKFPFDLCVGILLCPFSWSPSAPISQRSWTRAIEYRQPFVFFIKNIQANKANNVVQVANSCSKRKPSRHHQQWTVKWMQILFAWLSRKLNFLPNNRSQFWKLFWLSFP